MALSIDLGYHPHLDAHEALVSHVTHANADLTPKARGRLTLLVLEEGWTLRRPADRFKRSSATAKKWTNRSRTYGEAGMTEVSSRPCRSPNRTGARTERRIVAPGFSRRWDPHRTAAHLHLARSTVGKVLARYRMPRLACLDHGTDLPARKRTTTRRTREPRGPDPHGH